MLFDLNTLGIHTNLKKYDVCICGAGPAGITLARTLASHGKTVALLEGGGLEYSDQSQDIYNGKNIGLNNWNAISNCRLRYFGGTSNHWAGRCAFFDPVDFEQRDYFGLPGWPTDSREEMFKHFDAACAIVDLPKDAFRTPSKSNWKGTNFRLSVKELSPPTRFRTKYLEELKRSEKIDLFINANITDIRLNESLASVSHLEVRNYHKHIFHFYSENYVLASGGIENARLLLNSEKQISGGVGNQNDMVGRCFMEHFNVNFGRFIVEDKLMWEHGPVEFNPTEAYIRSRNIGNAVLSFDPNFHFGSSGHLRKLKQFARDMVCKSKTLTELSRKHIEFDCDGDGVITSLIEQAPNRDSRITLDSEKDMFGMRRVIMNWKPNSSDDLTIRTLGRDVAKEFARTRLARVQLKDFILDDSIEIGDYGQHCHQMGTTRISNDPKFGVVDRNQRVHGLANLFIAGSSVFPTGGGCNPTLTIVMMSLGLAKHIASLPS